MTTLTRCVTDGVRVALVSRLAVANSKSSDLGLTTSVSFDYHDNQSQVDSPCSPFHSTLRELAPSMTNMFVGPTRPVPQHPESSFVSRRIFIILDHDRLLVHSFGGPLKHDGFIKACVLLT